MYAILRRAWRIDRSEVDSVPQDPARRHDLLESLPVVTAVPRKILQATEFFDRSYGQRVVGCVMIMR
ncbi:hypothetical protein VQ03_04235 [Methylobacterium tarhaniae]|uniref:Uncharacterized protein n=1 Tax=Methylobacterium tarhaniae TaxID=1187852 RepID=A0A0J6VXW1_9HYPH|nr:hypothetical protein VQ03_04235 [Methylobacterium tarhaniae]